MAVEGKVTTLKQLCKAVAEILTLKDDSVVDLICATVVGNRLNVDPIWLMLVAPSSGGKTELVNSLTDLDFIYPISSLTAQTFASGMMNSRKETSLLFKVDQKIMVFKDFTTILEMHRDTRNEIMTQLREIYEGRFDKDFGTGESVKWKGKVGIIACTTPGGAYKLQENSIMGERFILFNIEQPSRKEMSKKVRENREKDLFEERQKMRDAFTEYLNYMVEIAETKAVTVKIDNETEEQLSELADFCTLARSGVNTDSRTGQLKYVPEAEMPGRFDGQLLSLAKAFQIMENGVLRVRHKKIMYKIAMSSIPATRMLVLGILTVFADSDTASIASKLNYPTDTVKVWLNELNGLGVIQRIAKGAGAADKWILREEYRNIMEKYTELKKTDTSLRPDTEIEEDGTPVKESDIEVKLPEALKQTMSEQLRMLGGSEPTVEYDDGTYE